jgi:hypothetical protein
LTDRGRIDNFVTRDRLGFLKDNVCNVLWSGSTIRDIVLDTKVVVGASRIVAGSQKNASSGFVLANYIRGSGCGQDAILSDNKLGDAVGRTNPKDDLDSLW